MVCGNITKHHRVGANDSVVSDDHMAEQFRSGAEIDVTTYGGRTSRLKSAQGHLLKYEAVWANASFWVNDHPIRVRNAQSPADGTVQWDVGARQHAPKAVPEHAPPSKRVTPSTSTPPSLVVADACQKSLARVPFAICQTFALPVGFCRADHLSLFLEMTHLRKRKQSSLHGEGTSSDSEARTSKMGATLKGIVHLFTLGPACIGLV